MSKEYEKIVQHYEQCFKIHGDNHLGMDWPKLEDNLKRFSVMLEVMKNDIRAHGKTRLLDFGCGTAHLLEFVLNNKIDLDAYFGIDYSELFIQHCIEKYPNYQFLSGDVLSDNFNLPSFDYAVMNGVFTEKRELSQAQMWEYFQSVIVKVFDAAERGIAFNTMSKNVDWERDDLFHVSIDELTKWLSKEVSRHIIVRQDYGLYEFTTYLYKS